jgi:hypothetical protein
MEQEMLQGLNEFIASRQVHPSLFHFEKVSLEPGIGGGLGHFPALRRARVTIAHVLRKEPEHNGNSSWSVASAVLKGLKVFQHWGALPHA